MGEPPRPMLLDFAAEVGADRVWVAEEGARIVGAIVQYETERGFYIDVVAVLPDMQGKGVGRALLIFAEQEARRRRYDSVYLCTNAKMTENLVLYPKIGYRECGRQQVGANERVFYSKAL
jgi:GNAT superfamily N-acetyltransferase